MKIKGEGGRRALCMNDFFGFVMQRRMMFGDIAPYLDLPGAQEKRNWSWDERQRSHQSCIYMELGHLLKMVLLVTTAAVEFYVWTGVLVGANPFQ